MAGGKEDSKKISVEISLSQEEYDRLSQLIIKAGIACSISILYEDDENDSEALEDQYKKFQLEVPAGLLRVTVGHLKNFGNHDTAVGINISKHDDGFVIEGLMLSNKYDEFVAFIGKVTEDRVIIHLTPTLDEQVADDEDGLERHDARYWQEQITPDLKKRALEASVRRKALLDENISAPAVDPKTGKIGRFVRFEGVFPRVHSVYKTETGEEFYLTSGPIEVTLQEMRKLAEDLCLKLKEEFGFYKREGNLLSAEMDHIYVEDTYLVVEDENRGSYQIRLHYSKKSASKIIQFMQENGWRVVNDLSDSFRHGINKQSTGASFLKKDVKIVKSH